MVSNENLRKPLRVWLATAAMAGALALTHAAAHADGPPLILDTQRGIIDGQKGMVLQNAPLSREPMVAAPQLAAPAGLVTDSSQPYIVAPYIAVPGGGGSRPNLPRPPHPPRPLHPTHPRATVIPPITPQFVPPLIPQTAPAQ
jgi:hypothetical protein